jgi:hypothetical protein
MRWDHLSRFVAGVSPSRDRHHRTEDVLHRDDNPLNCQKANLVVVTRGVASAKARKTRTRESTSTYKGVIWQQATAASEPDSLLVAPYRCWSTFTDFHSPSVREDFRGLRWASSLFSAERSSIFR